MDANPFINIQSVAIVGASGDPSKTSGRPVSFLAQHAFEGAIWPINPRRNEVQGIKAFPSLKELPGRPDIAFIMLDTEQAMVSLAEAVELKIPLVAILANGFSESGEVGRAREQRLVEMLAGTGTRVLGPNSLGMIRPSTGLICTANAAFAADEIPEGNISVISQSGSAIGTFVSRGRARGIGFANLISVGNEADLSVGEIGCFLAEDDRTDVFILFLESIKHVSDLKRFARVAEATGKRVLVYKIGRSEVGAELAVSHTGAIVSSDNSVDALIRDLGFVRFDNFEAIFEGASLFAHRWQSNTNARKSVSIVSTTGGGGALVADRLGSSGISVCGPSETVRSKISKSGVTIGAGPLIDLTLAGTNPEVMETAIDAVLDEDETDVAIAVIGSSAEHYPELAVKPIIELMQRRKVTKPLAVFTVPHATAALTLLAQAGVPAFRTPEACADAVASYILGSNSTVRSRTFKHCSHVVEAAGALSERSNEMDALDLFDQLGLPTAKRCFINFDGKPDAEQLEALSYPVVVKISSEELPHKSDAGGVTLDVQSFEGVCNAIASMSTAMSSKFPSIDVDGYLVQEQRTGIIEAIVGVTIDAAVGPIVSVGMGGIFAEIYKDTSVRCAPVSTEEAIEMINEVAGFQIASGYRGKPMGDLQALAEFVSKFSELAGINGISEAEINPVLVGENGQGVCAVDGLIIKHGVGTQE